MGTTVRNGLEYIASIDNFKTLAQKTEQELIPSNVGNAAQNLRFDNTYGSIAKRKNRTKYAGMSTLGTTRIISAYRYCKNSNTTKHQLVVYGTTIKEGNDSTGAFTNKKTGLTADLRAMWWTFKDLCYFFNGTDNNQVYDGTNNTENMGVPVPSAPTMAEDVAGNPNGAYKYKVTYEIDGYQEGSASAASATITVTSKKILVTIPVSTNTRVTKRILYRTVASGAVYNKLATVSNNTDTTYLDNIADGSLDTTITAPTDYGAPASYKYGCLHKFRLFLARNSSNLSRVIYSDVRSGIAYPDVFPANNYFDVLKDNGEEITFIGQDNFGQLIIMKPSAVLKIDTDMDDPVGWSGFDRIFSINGCVAAYSVAKTDVGLIYLSRYGEMKKMLMLWDGMVAKPIFEELEPVLSAILDTRLTDCVGHYANGAYYLAYNDISTGEIYNNRVLIIDLKTGSWTIDKKNVDCFASWNAGTDWGELYSGSADTSGFLHREDTTLEDLQIKLKSQLDLGTFSQCQSGGSEESPTLTLIQAQLTDDIGATTVSAASGVVSTYEDLDTNETVAPSSIYTSPVLEVSAKNLLNLYWSEVIGTGGYVRFWVRTGDTTTACQAASWSGPYSTAAGSDISAVTAAKYIQYKVKLYVENTANAAGTYLQLASGYMVKITFGYGTLIETAIEMIYSSNWLDFSWINPVFKRSRKRMRSVKIEFDRTDTTGTWQFGYYLDGSSTRTDKTFNFSTDASRGYSIYHFPFTTFCNRIKYRLYNNDDDDFKIKKVIFNFSVEPFLSYI